MEIKALIFDIDGVITDGKKYTDGISQEIKTIAYKDMDAINDLIKEGIVVGCISGEDTAFSRKIAGNLTYCSLGLKNKRSILEEFSEKYRIQSNFICYIGDGKYDIEALEYAGLAVCPHDAIYEVKKASDIILETPGGCGCIAEVYTKIHQMKDKGMRQSVHENNIAETIKNRIKTHSEMVESILNDRQMTNVIAAVCQEIINAFRNGKQLFLCGNGGSAADAQHIAAELVGKFYLERKAYPAEALTTNTSVITALANDYDYSRIYARQVEAKGGTGDILIGITTSGRSKNILEAFRQAKDSGMRTVLMTGRVKERLPILEYTDYSIGIPSGDTPRIQEGHLLVGHILCEIIENKLMEECEKNE